MEHYISPEPYSSDIGELKLVGQERESAAELEDVRRLVKVARKTKTLAAHAKKWEAVEEYFNEYGIEDEDLHLWRAYRSLISQRSMGMYNDILKLTDILAQDFYHTFFDSPLLKGSLKRYAIDALPLTFLGRSEDYYYTYTHAHEHPIAVVSIPRRGQTSAWNWLALPHEIGHNIFDNILGYERELTRKIRNTLADVRFKIPGKRLPYKIPKSALMEIIWTNWLDEIMADVIGILFSGPAYAMARQEDACNIASDLGGANITLWDIKGMDMMKHPVCHFRVIIIMEVLKLMGFAGDASMLELRWVHMYPNITEYVWLDPTQNYRELFRIDRHELESAMDIVLNIILYRSVRVLMNNSLREIICYDSGEHLKVLQIERELTKKRPKIPPDTRPRMVLAASRYAFEREPTSADLIHENVEKAIVRLEKNIKPTAKVRKKKKKSSN